MHQYVPVAIFNLSTCCNNQWKMLDTLTCTVQHSRPHVMCQRRLLETHSAQHSTILVQPVSLFCLPLHIVHTTFRWVKPCCDPFPTLLLAAVAIPYIPAAQLIALAVVSLHYPRLVSTLLHALTALKGTIDQRNLRTLSEFTIGSRRSVHVASVVLFLSKNKDVLRHNTS